MNISELKQRAKNILAVDHWGYVGYILLAGVIMGALEMSRKMTDGRKMDIFVLQLSFIGWFILSALTLGILGICYVNPYYTLSMQECYFYLKYTTFGDTDPLAQNFNGQYTGQFMPGYQQTNYGQDYQNQNSNYNQNPSTDNQDQNADNQNNGFEQ